MEFCEHRREELRWCITEGEGPASHYEKTPFITDALTVQVIETVRLIPIFQFYLQRSNLLSFTLEGYLENCVIRFVLSSVSDSSAKPLCSYIPAQSLKHMIARYTVGQ
jgi:hypothetical protein